MQRNMKLTLGDRHGARARYCDLTSDSPLLSVAHLTSSVEALVIEKRVRVVSPVQLVFHSHPFLFPTSPGKVTHFCSLCLCLLGRFVHGYSMRQKSRGYKNIVFFLLEHFIGLEETFEFGKFQSSKNLGFKVILEGWEGT